MTDPTSNPSPYESTFENPEISQYDLSDQIILGQELQESERGRFARIFEGKHPKIGDVAVKVILRRRCDDDDTLKKDTAREFKVWFPLQHKNILHLEGFYIYDNCPALVSIWMKDGSLWNYMKEGKLDTPRDAMSMIRGVASGLAYMHKCGAIHGDIKSDNILVSPEKQPLLTDFGLTVKDGLTKRLLTASFASSLHWQAKELFTEDTFKHTTLTDVWAFGMTVYELLTRSRPYHDVNQKESYLKRYIGSGKVPLKPTYSTDIPIAEIEQYMWSLCERCCQWKGEPESRLSMEALEMEIGPKCAGFGVVS